MNPAVAVSRPSLFWLMTEPGRALTELGFSFTFNSLYKSKAKGDGHPVMILPGFMSTKQSTKILRHFIEKQGYKVYDWGLGRNLGKVEYIDILTTTLDEIHKKTGQQVSLIGWSLGGVFARQLAKNRPNLVRQIITLGSPFAGLTEPNNVSWVYTMISGGKNVKDTDLALLKNLPLPAPVPTTAIYSKEDGIVPWQACLETKEDETHQNIQVRGSHIGLGVNPSVLTVIADRLKLSKQNWQYFKPTGLDSLLFP